MGIPMYRDPSPDATKNSTLKDSSAAARSAIRRQTTVRRPSRHSTSALRGASLRSPFPHAIADEIEREVHGLQRHIRSPIANRPPSDDPLDIIAGDLDMIRREVGEGLLHEAAQHRRPGQRMRIPRNTTFLELNRRPTPADSLSGLRNPEQPAFTPSFAPAVAYHRRLSPPSQMRPRLSPFPPDGFEVIGTTVPLLRRVGQRSINDSNRAINRDFTIDGLGDRQRSMSPDDDHANDAWETLLTTITPDDNLPSANSSFASTSASGANTSTNAITRDSTVSVQTLPTSLDSNSATVRMVLDPYPEYVNPCDYPSSSDSDSASDGDFNQLSLWRRYRRRMHQMGSGRRSQDVHSTMSSLPPNPAISFAFANSSTDPELQQMQAILDRLARRENIPDDWWAAAGLSRTISNRRAANNDSNNPDNGDDPTRRL